MPELTGKRVVVTRPAEQAGEFVRALREAGADPICFPVIEIRPIQGNIALERALQKIACYDWLVLTSVNGVRVLWEQMEEQGIKQLPSTLKVAAIGPKTADAIRQRGANLDFVPDEYVAEAILPGLGDLRGRWVLLPRAELARAALPQAIAAAGGVAHEIAVYHTLPAAPDPDGLRKIQDGVDVITFTSSSTVHNFIVLLQRSGLDPFRLSRSPRIACIGPITAGTAREEGFQVDVVAEEYTSQGLIEALGKG